MARPFRLQGEDYSYHVTNGGDDRKKIFTRDWRQYQRFVLDGVGNLQDPLIKAGIAIERLIENDKNIYHEIRRIVTSFQV